MKLQSKFLMIGLTSVMLIIAMVMMNNRATTISAATSWRLRHIASVSQQHMQSALMVDAIRGDVLNAVVAGISNDPQTLSITSQDLAQHLKIFQEAVNANRNAMLPNNIRADFEKTMQAITLYQARAQKVIDAIGRGEDTTIARNQFNQEFEQLSMLMNAITENIQAWSKEEERQATALITEIQKMTWILSLFSIVLALAVPLYAWNAIFLPNRKLVQAIENIAEGNVENEVHGRKRPDEIGELARAAEALRKNIQEQERLKCAAEEERKITMQQLAQQFEQRVQSIVQTVAAAATQLAQTADITIASATRSQDMVQEATSGAVQTSGNVQSVASAAEELSAAVREISAQLMRSTLLVNDSMHKTQDADQRAKSLAQAAEKVKEVVGLISEIASQTNLLALNATIESARAGEAGKGFAVVAAEVKNLATQTENSIADINRVIQEMSKAAGEIVESLHGIRGSVTQISESASGISSAVEEQAATTNEIVRNMQTAAHGTSNISENLTRISSASMEASGSSQQVAAAARELSIQAENLDKQVRDFLQEIRAA